MSLLKYNIIPFDLIYLENLTSSYVLVSTELHEDSFTKLSVRA